MSTANQSVEYRKHGVCIHRRPKHKQNQSSQTASCQNKHISLATAVAQHEPVARFTEMAHSLIQLPDEYPASRLAHKLTSHLDPPLRHRPPPLPHCRQRRPHQSPSH